MKNRPRSGRRARLDADQAEAVREWLEAGPDPGAGEPARWTVADIRQMIENLFEVKYSVEGVRLLMRRLGFRNVSPRPIHPKADPRAQEEFRSSFKALAREVLPGGVSPESAGVWFQDEARIGQKGMLSRVWARKGTRPRIPPRPQVRILLPVLRRLPLDRPGRRPCLRAGQYRRNEPASQGCRRGRPPREGTQ